MKPYPSPAAPSRFSHACAILIYKQLKKRWRRSKRVAQVSDLRRQIEDLPYAPPEAQGTLVEIEKKIKK